MFLKSIPIAFVPSKPIKAFRVRNLETKQIVKFDTSFDTSVAFEITNIKDKYVDIDIAIEKFLDVDDKYTA